MNRLVFLLFFMISSTVLKAQINEIGVFLGGSNYIGDVGPTNYIAPNDIAIGFVYKWNRSTRHTYRFSYTYGQLSSNDADSDVPDRNLRGLSFENKVNELSAGLEFNFFDFDLHHFKPQTTPYVATGINYYSYKELYFFDGIANEELAPLGTVLALVH